MYSESHVGARFINTFGEALTMLRKLFITENPASQPVVVSGSGTLGWDFVAANLAELGDEVLVLHTGETTDTALNTVDIDVDPWARVLCRLLCGVFLYLRSPANSIESPHWIGAFARRS